MLLSGHHARIQAWKRLESIKQTAQVRPELLQHTELTPREQELIEQLIGEEKNHELA